MRHSALAAILLVTLALPCAAQHAISAYGGYRGGGSFDENTSPFQSISLKSSVSGAITVDWGIDASRQVQLFASTQSTDLPATGNSPTLPMTVSYLHLGGTNFFEGGVGRGMYVVGGLGVTRFAPGLSGLSAEYRPSMNLGLGYQLPISGPLSLRFELRGYFTLINSSTNLFCSGGCVVSVKGDGFTQAEALVGLSYGF